VSPFEIAGLTIFILVLFTGIYSIALGIPGTIIILIDVILYSLITGFERIGIMIIILLIVISIVAEAMDFALGMSRAAHFGITKRGIVISVIGSILGAAVMTPFLLGLGTVIGIFLGGFAGILIVELIRQSKLKPARREGYGAILGRVAGTLVKGFCALAMIIITMTNIYS
jgi:uncharacterized protein YqgC (DUF456 family)